MQKTILAQNTTNIYKKFCSHPNLQRKKKRKKEREKTTKIYKKWELKRKLQLLNIINVNRMLLSI